MRPQALWALSIAVSAESEEPVAEFLALRFGQSPAVYSNLQTSKTTVTLYLQRKPDWSRAARADLSAALKRIGKGRSNAISAPLRLTQLRPQNWAESWKRHFKPLTIGTKLLIQPTWGKRRPKSGQSEVLLDPGMSFGTGQHATTGFCLRELARWRQPSTEQSFLDIGTGSGILAICAAKLGYQPVHALDFDRSCLKTGRANARLNHVEKQIRFRCQDLKSGSSGWARKYSMVCANLMADLLLAATERVLRTVEPGGRLVLAGILDREFPAVRAAYEGAGLRLVGSRLEGEWRSGCFTRIF